MLNEYGTHYIIKLSILQLTTHIVTLLPRAEAVIIAHAATIGEGFTLSSGSVVAPGGDGCTTWSRVNGVETLAEVRAFLWRDTPVTQLHCSIWTLTSLWEGGRKRGREELSSDLPKLAVNVVLTYTYFNAAELVIFILTVTWASRSTFSVHTLSRTCMFN